MNLVNIEDSLGDNFELNPEIDIIPMVSYLPKLFIGHNICIETGYINNVFELKQLLAYKHIDFNIDLAITLYIGTAIAYENKINLI